jgi:hypothetical protein
MSQGNAQRIDREAFLDRFAAELTVAAYLIALKYRIAGSSLDLELEIWKTLTDVVRKRGRELCGESGTNRVPGTQPGRQVDWPLR